MVQMSKSTSMYWTPVTIAVPDDDRQVLLCKQAKNGNISYSLGYYDGERFVTNGCAKVTHWIDYPDVVLHHYQFWLQLRDSAAPGFKWVSAEGGDE